MESFESYRPYLFSIAYRMLGSAMDAEDMVQETYLRYQSTPKDDIRSLKAFLTTILTRLCMDQLQLARRKREVYVGPWLPEPILTTTTPASEDPAERVEREESISLAFLALLEELQPFERAVFLLHEVFGYEFSEMPPCLTRVKRPLAAPSAGRSSTCRHIGHALAPLPKPIGSCSAGTFRPSRPVR